MSPHSAKNKIYLIIAAVVILLLAAGGVGLACIKSQTTNSETVRIYLPHCEDPHAARDTLAAHALVKEGPIFNLMARILKLDQLWHPGSYLVQPHTPLLHLLHDITRGQQTPIHLTIGKFRTPQQLNEFLGSKLMHNDFDIPLDSFHFIRPNTYEFYWTVSPAAFMERMKKEYDRQALSLEAIILASIVEEETNHNPEKPLIASVYLNRLRRGMPLQADPTVKYALGDFALRRILHKHLTVESPFNTYLHTGLPPAPICLPSDASVKAVLQPAETDYLYFCASPNLDGTHRFASTLAQHNANAAAFHRALNARGIK